MSSTPLATQYSIEPAFSVLPVEVWMRKEKKKKSQGGKSLPYGCQSCLLTPSGRLLQGPEWDGLSIQDLAKAGLKAKFVQLPDGTYALQPLGLKTLRAWLRQFLKIISPGKNHDQTVQHTASLTRAVYYRDKGMLISGKSADKHVRWSLGGVEFKPSEEFPLHVSQKSSDSTQNSGSSPGYPEFIDCFPCRPGIQIEQMDQMDQMKRIADGAEALLQLADSPQSMLDRLKQVLANCHHSAANLENVKQNLHGTMHKLQRVIDEIEQSDAAAPFDEIEQSDAAAPFDEYTNVD